MTATIAIANGKSGAANGRLRAWLHELKERRRKRIAIRDLEDMPNYLLRDMGLTRDGIRHAVRHGRFG
ncbi:hypothetical protein DEA8626_03701 [Defluviimonas aquaemixtae]|uniref:DUF1127 domain-containing protein n=1 Tax=Albidovulum aquaemixtae TaxID=1542388 RepID=A0A2R8BMK4_9RHOB|nr:DUF1127 domain-containing protein [Defluviimonas aquaemixtae]SPH24650.1 hypothetical protein DEA8626_03701 [Defluviimonas aquaemixtae]